MKLADKLSGYARAILRAKTIDEAHREARLMLKLIEKGDDAK